MSTVIHVMRRFSTTLVVCSDSSPICFFVDFFSFYSMYVLVVVVYSSFQVHHRVTLSFRVSLFFVRLGIGVENRAYGVGKKSRSEKLYSGVAYPFWYPFLYIEASLDTTGSLIRQHQSRSHKLPHFTVTDSLFVSNTFFCLPTSFFFAGLACFAIE